MGIRPPCPVCGRELSLQVSSFYCTACGRTFARDSAPADPAVVPVASILVNIASHVADSPAQANVVTRCPTCGTLLARQATSYYCPRCGKTYPQESIRQEGDSTTAHEFKPQGAARVAETRTPLPQKASQNNLEVFKVLGIIAACLAVLYFVSYSMKIITASFLNGILETFGVVGVLIACAVLFIGVTYLERRSKQSGRK